MKKIISVLLILMLAVSVFATVTVASAAELKIQSWDFTEDWSGYEVADYTGSSGRNMKLNSANGGGDGDWMVHYEYTNKDVIQVVDGETWEHSGIKVAKGSGNVLYINNRVSNGTYVNVGYVGTDAEGGELYARNFTLEYDFMPLHTDRTSGWTGLISRWTVFDGSIDTNVNYSAAKDVISTISMTTGTSSDRVTLSDGTTRPATNTDYAYHSRSATASSSGANDMTYESGIDRVSDLFFLLDGGGMRYTWFSLRIEAKDTRYTIYIKQKCTDDCEADCTEHRWFDTGTRYYDDPQNNIYSGTIGFGQCASEFLYDNIVFKSNDSPTGSPNVTATNLTKNADQQEIGKAYSLANTASEGSLIQLVSETEPGYVFDKWYKDADCSDPVTPVEFTLQEYVLNTNYGLYDWEPVRGATDDIKTWEDLETKTVFVKDDKIVEEGTEDAEEMLWRDYYSTSANRKFRLLTRVKTTGSSADGYDFYSIASLKEFKVEVYSCYEDWGTVAISGTDELIGKFVLGQEGHLIATAKEGYKFAGWYKEVKGENPDDEGGIKDEIFTVRETTEADYNYVLTEPAHVTYKAVFVPETADVATLTLDKYIDSTTATKDEAGSIITVVGDYFNGEIVTLIAKENDGFAFVGWKYEGASEADGYISTDKYYDYVVTSGANNIIAEFEIETFRVYVLEGPWSTEIVRTAQANSKLTLYPTDAPAGYEFDRWNVTGISPDDWLTDESGKLEINVTSRTIRVVAEYNKEMTSTKRVRLLFDREFATVEGEFADSESAIKRVGDKVTIKVTPNDGYSVSRFTLNGVSATVNEDGSLSFTMPNKNVIISMEFATIDKIDTTAEITMYAVFALVGLGIVASLLFANTKDKRDKR